MTGLGRKDKHGGGTPLPQCGAVPQSQDLRLGMRPGQGCLGLAKPGRPEVGDGPLRIEAGRLSSLSRDTQGPEAGFGPTSPDPKASGLAPPAHVSTLIVYTSAFPAFLAVDSSSVEIFTEFLWPQRK